tara:strand:+ start:365 stop:766 length:402 start_codon:yes stop_codon:yes gene_type:complete
MTDWPWKKLVDDFKHRAQKNEDDMDRLCEKVGDLEGRVDSLIQVLSAMDNDLKSWTNSRLLHGDKADRLLSDIESRLTDIEFFSYPNPSLFERFSSLFVRFYSFILKHQILLLSCLCSGAAAAGAVWLILDKM